MDARELLLEQTRHHHRALGLATDVTLGQARWPVGGADPSIATLLAHLVEDTAVTARALCGREIAVRGLADPLDEAGWRALRADGSALSKELLSGLEALAPADLDAPPLVVLMPAFRASLATRARFWSGHVFHLAYHLGQIGRLRARQGLGWWTEACSDPGPPARG